MSVILVTFPSAPKVSEEAIEQVNLNLDTCGICSHVHVCLCLLFVSSVFTVINK